MFLITNFKTYETAIWIAGVGLAKIHAEVRQQTGKNIQIAWNPLDLRMLLDLDIPVLSQHVDFAEYWSYTWKIPPIKLKKIWCSWVVLNHSENRVNNDELLWKIINRCKEVWLDVIVCAENVNEWIEIAHMWADFIAIEPPELIWGDISVSKANPEIITDAVNKIWKWKVIVWAWIKTAEDIEIAKKLWASWILLASWVTKAKYPKDILLELAQAL